MNLPRTVVAAAAATAALALTAAAPAHAASCAVDPSNPSASGVTFDQTGQAASFSGLTAMRGMNCKSARYVLNRWLRPAYAANYDGTLPTRFYDGYVTWRCGKRSALRWQCSERDSGTAFRFTARLIQD